jgi:hypothetical protein
MFSSTARITPESLMTHRIFWLSVTGHLACLTAFFVAATVHASDDNVRLPQAREYQRVLRTYMASLTEQDFVHGVTETLSVKPSSQDRDYEFRNYLLTRMQQPLVGTKRGYPAVNAPARLFTLDAIEGDEAIMKPPVWPEALMSFVQWDYPGNPYFDNKALKLRAFAWCGMNLMMVDEYMDKEATSRRAEHFAYQLVIMGSPYAGFRDLLPPEVRQAYQTGIRRFAERIIDWGVRGEEHYYDMIIPIGLWYASQVVDDPDFTKAVEAHARMMFTDPRYIHPAGYFLDHGGPELARGGTTNYFVVWAALASDWPFAKDAVARIYRLRAHLLLPEPDGITVGPSQFNTLRGAPVSKDNWDWNGTREHAAAMLTDEASCQAPWPTTEELTGAAAKRLAAFNFQLSQNPIKERTRPGYIYYDNDEIPSVPWSNRLWPTYNFPATVNHSYEFYRKGAYARRQQLEQQQSPLVSLPFHRPGTFVRNFENAFVVARQPAYGVVLHTGPIGRQPPDGGATNKRTDSNASNVPWKTLHEPLGFGGGQLSAFWTPGTGSILLGRRRGLTSEKSLDRIDEWRQWPIHAVTGETTNGTVISSALIVDPQVTMNVTAAGGTVEVAGIIPAIPSDQERPLKSRIDYRRVFSINRDSIRIETAVSTSDADELSELYESLPVFHREGRAPQLDESLTTRIEFLVNGRWQPATEEPHDGVTVIRLTRFNGEIRITFDEPQRLMLSPQDWKDTYITRAVCRNIMVDFLASGTKTVAYTIAATAVSQR